VLAKDLALITNQMMDAENFSDPNTKKKDGDGVTARTVSELCRNMFRLPVERAGSKGGGNAVVLDKELIESIKFRFGMDQVDLEEPKQLEIDV